MDLIDFFTKNIPPRQKQYEAIRAVAFNEGTISEIAQRFGYTPQSLRTLVNIGLSTENINYFPMYKEDRKEDGLQEKRRNLSFRYAVKRKLTLEKSLKNSLTIILR